MARGRALTTTAFSTRDSSLALPPAMLLCARPLVAPGVTALAERRRARRSGFETGGLGGVSGMSDSAAGVVRRRLGDAVAGLLPLAVRRGLWKAETEAPPALLLRLPRRSELRHADMIQLA